MFVGQSHIKAICSLSTVHSCGNSYGFRKKRCLKDIFFFERKIVIFQSEVNEKKIKFYDIIKYEERDK